MERDVDQIVKAVQEIFPGTKVEQLKVTHPGDDDGLWFFDIPNKKAKSR